MRTENEKNQAAETQFSRTALMTAYMRAYHAAYDTPKIFDDFLACHFVPEKARQIIEQHLMGLFQLYDPVRAALCPDRATALAWSMRAMAASILSRARYAEESLEKAVRQGVKQYVILGAGFDTFVFRRSEMLEKIRVFEVDHPATQAFKRRCLAELGWEIPEKLHSVPVDFEQESLAEALSRSPYYPHTLSFFSWMGVTHYLTRDAVFTTLRSIADIAPAGSMVVFDYLDTGAFIPGRADKRVQALKESVQQVGETMRGGLDPSMLTADLACLGLRLKEDLEPSDIQERYFQGRTDDYHANRHTHFTRALVG